VEFLSGKKYQKEALRPSPQRAAAKRRRLQKQAERNGEDEQELSLKVRCLNRAVRNRPGAEAQLPSASSPHGIQLHRVAPRIRYVRPRQFRIGEHAERHQAILVVRLPPFKLSCTTPEIVIGGTMRQKDQIQVHTFIFGILPMVL